MDTLRAIGRSTRLSITSSFVLWRWALLFALFILTAFLVEDTLDFYFRDGHVARKVDAWDIFPTIVSHTYVVHFLFAFGFLLLIGDLYHREREQGTAALLTVRMPSRPVYWLGKMGALGINACAFVGLSFVISLLVGFIIAPPSTMWPMLPRPNIRALEMHVHMPLPVYSLLLAAYTAWGLWVGGSVILLLSLFVRNTAIILGAIAGWVLLSMSGDWYFGGYIKLFLIGHILGMYKHHGEYAISMPVFFAFTTTVLISTALIGSWRMRREEV